MELLNKGLELFAGKRLFTALGNHNIDNPDIKRRVMEIGNMKNTYYCKKFKDNYVIVIIDTNLAGAEFGAMLGWIAETVRMLQASDTPYYLIQHEPFFSYKKGKANELKNGGDILRIIAAYPPTLILCADTHNYQENVISVGGVSMLQIVVGTGGAHHDPLGDTSAKIDHDDITYTIRNDTEGFGYLEVPASGAFAFQYVAAWRGGFMPSRTRKQRAGKILGEGAHGKTYDASCRVHGESFCKTMETFKADIQKVTLYTNDKKLVITAATEIDFFTE